MDLGAKRGGAAVRAPQEPQGRVVGRRLWASYHRVGLFKTHAMCRVSTLWPAHI